MTSPGGGGNNINLAALWVPVMAETSQLAPQMAKAGTEAQKKFAESFMSGPQSGEEMGKQWAGQFMKSFNSTFGGLPIPQGLKDFMGSLQNETRATEKELTKLNETARKTFSEHSRLAQQAAQMQAEITKRTEEYNRAVTRGTANPAERQAIIRLQREHSDVVAKATEAQARYTTSHTQLTQATEQTSMAQNLLAGAIGGGIGAAVTLGISAIGSLTSAYVKLWTEGISLAFNGVQMMAEKILETGQNYQDLSNQIQLYTTASGSQLQALEGVAAQAFGNMGSSAQELGRDIAILSQRLDIEASPALTTLAGHISELRGRFGQLDIEQFTAGLLAFQVPSERADDALASLVQSAREASTPINDVITALRSAAPTLDQAGLSYEQAAAFVAELTTRGLEARSMMTGLQTAQKEFSELGLSFSDGMKLAAERLEQLKAAGDTVAAQELSEKLFGTRRWAEALTMMETFSDIVSAQPGEFSATADSLDELINNTQTLGDKWTEVQRKSQEALRPLGEAAVGVISAGLDNLKAYIDRNMPQITSRIRELGNSFIEQLPGIKDFAADMIRVLGPVFDFVILNVQAMLLALGGMAQAIGMTMDLLPDWAEKLIPGYSELREGLKSVGEAGVDMAKELGNIDVSGTANDLADWIDDLNINVPEAQRNWNNLVDDINNNIPRGAGGAAGNFSMPSLPQLTGVPGLSGGRGGVGGAGGPGGGAGSVAGNVGAGAGAGGIGPGPLAGLPAGGGGGRGASIAIASGQIDPQTNRAIAMQMFPWAASEWGAFDELVSRESAWNNIAKNPRSTAFGLGQFLDMTWQNYGMPATGTADPSVQLGLMFRYISERYGTPSAALAFHDENNWYATGGTVKEAHVDPRRPVESMESEFCRIAREVNGPYDLPERCLYRCEGGSGPKGTDTVAAWLTPGEEVINADASEKWRPVLKAINAGYFEGGGTVTDTNTTLASKAPGMNVGVPDLVGWMKQLVEQFNSQSGTNLQITADRSGYAGKQPGDTGHGNQGGRSQHDVNRAIDISGTADEMRAFVDWWTSNPEFVSVTRQLISGAALDKNIYGGQLGSGNALYPKDIGGHYNHVHFALEGVPASLAGGGSGSMTIPMGYGDGGFTPTQGYTGGYGASDWEAQYRNEKAAREARQRAEDMDAEIERKRRGLADLEAKRAEEAKGTTDILGRPVAADPDKLRQYDQQIEDARADLAKSQRERADQDGEIAFAERKLAEGVKSGGRGGAKEYEIPGVSAFSQLGGGLLSGIGESLGLGDVFGKAPWEWGIVKLLAGFANWGIGTANSWADEIGKGHTGVTGFQELPGWEQGGSAGLMGLLGGAVPGLAPLLPKPVMREGATNGGQFPNVTTAPNVTAGQGISSGQGAGPAPGPVVQGDYQPIKVENHGPKQSDYDAWKGAQNQRSAGAMAGLPIP